MQTSINSEVMKAKSSIDEAGAATKIDTKMSDPKPAPQILRQKFLRPRFLRVSSRRLRFPSPPAAEPLSEAPAEKSPAPVERTEP